MGSNVPKHVRHQCCCKDRLFVAFRDSYQIASNTAKCCKKQCLLTMNPPAPLPPSAPMSRNPPIWAVEPPPLNRYKTK